MQSSAWPVSTYQVTSTQIQKELGELWDAASSHLRRDSLGPLVHPPLQHPHPWLRRLSVSFLPRPASSFLLVWMSTKPAMTALSWRLESWTWSKQARSVERHPRMPTPISRTSWRWVTPSTPEELLWMTSVFACSHSHCSGRPRHGSTPTRKLSWHGKLVQMHS